MDKPARSGWAALSLIAQLALTGCVTVLLVSCALLGALWYRGGSPDPRAYFLRDGQRPRSKLSAEPGSHEGLTPTPLSTVLPPSKDENSSLPPPAEAQPPDAEVAVSTPELATGETPPPPRQPSGEVRDVASPGRPAAGQASTGLLLSLPDRPATRIVIPSIGVDAPVVVIPIRDGTWDVKQITHEVGHLQGTASPGDRSNVVMAGHITLSTGGYGPFRGLAQLQAGDEILLYVGDREVYIYTVDTIKTVDAADVEVAYPTTEPILTLITCVNWDPVQSRYNNRLVVIARLGG